MAKIYLDAIRSVRPHGPHCLAGFSFGGLVVVEMTRMLQATGEATAAPIAGCSSALVTAT